MNKKTYNANSDAQFGTLPVLGKDRIYGFGKYTAVISGFALATWCFLIGGTLSLFVGVEQAFVASIAGNLIAVIIMVTATMVPAAKYGTDNYTNSSSFFGHNGTKIIMGIISIIQIVWVIVFCQMVGRAGIAIFNAITGSEIDNQIVLTLCGIIATLIVWWLTLKGPGLMGKINSIFAPLIIVIMIGMTIVIGKDYGFGEVMALDPLLPVENEWLNFLLAVEFSLGAGLSWWPNMGGLAKLCKSTKTAYWPNIIGLVFAATIGTVIGTAAALLLGNADPVTWMIPMGGLVLGVFALFSVSIANLTACSIITYNICIGLKQIKFFFNKKWSFVTGAFLLPVILLMFWADVIYSQFYIILGVATLIYSPIVAIQLIDYFVFRKQNLSVRDMYNKSETSRYRFWGGFNWIAILVFVLAIPVYLFFMDPFLLVTRNGFEYVTATGAATVFSLIAYFVLGKIFLLKKGKGGYSE